MKVGDKQPKLHVPQGPSSIPNNNCFLYLQNKCRTVEILLKEGRDTFKISRSKSVAITGKG